MVQKLPMRICILLFLILVLFQDAVTIAQTTDSLTSEVISIQEIDDYYNIAQENIHKNPELAAKNYEKVITWVDSLLTDKEKYQDYFSKQANAYRVLGSYAGMNDQNVRALEYQEKSLEIKRSIGERESQILNYKAISSNWGSAGDFEKAGVAADSAYNIAKETYSKTHLSDAARGKAAFFMATKVPDSADYYYKIAVETADSASSKVPKYAALDMYGRFLRDQGKIEESLPYVNQFLNAIKDNNDTIFFTATYLTIGESELALEKPRRAIESFEQGIYYAKETNQRDELVDLYNGLAKSYGAIKDYKKAFEIKKLFFEEYRKKRDTSAYRDRAEVAVKNKYALQKAVDSTAFAQQKIIDETELQRKANNRFWWAVTSLLILLGGIGFFYLRNRQRVKEHAYQNILLNNKVASKTEEINELLTETIQHIKSKERIAENLQKLSSEGEGITLRSIIADLKASKADHAKLILIKQNIEQVNFEFIKKIKSLHPNLTKTDIEICSFIRIGLSRKEVANLRNTSLEAVKSSRFRIKKKLNLGAEDNLDNYVNSL